MLSVEVVGIPEALWIQFRACLDCVLVAAGYFEMDRSSANLFRICSTLRIDVWFYVNSLNNINPNVSFLYPMFVSFGLGAPFFLHLSRFYAEKFSLLIKYFCSEIRDGGSSKATELLNSVNGLWMEKRRMFDVFSLHLLSSLQISISKHLNIVEQKSTKFAMEQKKVSEWAESKRERDLLFSARFSFPCTLFPPDPFEPVSCWYIDVSRTLESLAT